MTSTNVKSPRNKRPMSAEHREKIAESARRRWNMKGGGIGRGRKTTLPSSGGDGDACAGVHAVAIQTSEGWFSALVTDDGNGVRMRQLGRRRHFDSTAALVEAKACAARELAKLELAKAPKDDGEVA